MQTDSAANQISLCGRFPHTRNRYTWKDSNANQLTSSRLRSTVALVRRESLENIDVKDDILRIRIVYMPAPQKDFKNENVI